MSQGYHGSEVESSPWFRLLWMFLFFLLVFYGAACRQRSLFFSIVCFLRRRDPNQYVDRSSPVRA